MVVPAEKATAPVKVGEAKGAFKSNAACWAVETSLLASLVFVTLPRPTIEAVMPLTVPVNVGDASGAFKFSAVSWAAETGLSASLVFVTLLRPTIPAVMPLTVPVNVGDASGAFKFSAVSWAAETGLSASLVFVTLPMPTIAGVMPLTVPVKLGESSGALMPWSFPMAVRMLSASVSEPVAEANPVRSFAVTVASAMVVAFCAPVTSPDRFPLKLPAARAFPAWMA